MTTAQDVLEAMLRHWPQRMPSWPDPHIDGEPAREEYSRVTDGLRYRVVVERARAWALACGEVLGAEVTAVEPVVGSERSRGGWVVTSPRSDTTPLRVEVFEGELPSVALGCGEAHGITLVPDCGCDACDCGSEPLLERIDAWFVHALTGGLAHIWGDRWCATSHPDGDSCGGAAAAPVQMTSGAARTQLDVIAWGGVPDVPDGLHWVWSGRWVD